MSKVSVDVKRFMGLADYTGMFSPSIAELTHPQDQLKTDDDWE